MSSPNLVNKSPRRYEQAKEAMREYIRINRLGAGAKLPTEEILCAHFGWSRVTIARALNELASEGSLRRVQGSGTYVASPNENGRKFRILVSSHPEKEDDDYCGQLFSGLRFEAATHQVDIVFDTQKVFEVERLSKMKVDGIIALSWRIDDLPFALAMHEAGVPLVGLALRSRSHQLPLICTDNFGGSCQAVDHLLSHGHRKIAFCCVNIINSDIFERISGFHYAMARCGLVVDPAYLQVSGWRREVPFLETWWRSLNPKPSAIVMDGTDAAAMLAALARQGVRIPEDVSVVVIDERRGLEHYWPPLTVVKQPTYQLGRRGLEKLLAMLRGEDNGEAEILPTELIPRQSVKSLNAIEASLPSA